MSSESKYSLASKLAQFLRKNGDKVINGSCKLSLTTSALCLLNTLFSDILHPEWGCTVEVPISEIPYIIEDVRFLYDFMKRTSSLKLFHGLQTLRGGVDLSHFSNLTALELRKLPAHLIIGLDCLSVQMKSLVCSRSIYLLKELFGKCNECDDELHIWAELKELNLSYNYLENLDNSLQSLPNIEILDLSHNHIKIADDLGVLEKLCFVNLSFNNLIYLPNFNVTSCRSLTKLNVRNNSLENLEGLDCLFNLEELDAGYNLLSVYSVLSPLDKLKHLTMLNLEGNPLYFHSQHVNLVCRFIHPGTLDREFHLNGKVLSLSRAQPNETFRTPGKHSNHQIGINAVVGGGNIEEPRISQTLSEQSCDDSSVASSPTSINDAEAYIKEGVRNMKKSRRKKSSAKVRLMREALISEANRRSMGEDPYVKPNKTVIPNHIKVKAIIETRREEHGESWLYSDPFGKPIVPIPKVPTNTPIVTDHNFDSKQEFVQHSSSFKDDIKSDSQLPHGQSSECLNAGTIKPINEVSPCTEMASMLDLNSNSLEIQQPRDRHHSKDSDDIQIITSVSQLEHSTSPTKENYSEYDIYQTMERDNIEHEYEEMLESEDEGEDSIFFVEKLDDEKVEPLTLIIGPDYLKEKNGQTGKALEKFDLNGLISISTSGENCKRTQLHLAFDTAKISKQKRIYVFDCEDSLKVFHNILQPFADARTFREATEGALECIKCNSQFSKQGAHKKLVMTKKPDGPLPSSYDSNKEYPQEVDACPNCGNHILIEMESFPLPAAPVMAFSKDIPDVSSGVTVSSQPNKHISELISSIKLSPSPRKKSSSSSTSQYNNKAQAEKIEGTQDLNISRNSSDITIVSHPSQTSIGLVPDLEDDFHLNAILERSSHSSTSPPFSQDSTFYNVHSSTPNSEDILKDKTQGMAKGGNDIDAKNVEEVISDNSNFHALEDYRTSLNEQSIEGLSQHGDDDNILHKLNILAERRVVSHELFSELDHRVKLHLEINIFKEDEQMVACLKTPIVPLSTGVEFEGLFVISSKKFYIIKFLSSYSEDFAECHVVEKTIQIIHSCPFNHMQQIKLLLGSMGLTINLSTTIFTLMVRDADICNSFSSLLADLVQEQNDMKSPVSFLSPEGSLQQLKESVFLAWAESDPLPEILLHLFASWCLVSAREKTVNQPVCIIITQDDIYVSKILYKKQESCADISNLSVYHYSEMDHQKLSDLISLNVMQDNRSVDVSFMNESSGLESCDSMSWTLTMETSSALLSFLSALKTPWESIFGVPIPLTFDS